MTSDLEIRVCTMTKIVSLGGSQSLGQLEPHAGSEAKVNAIVNAIVSLEFDGTAITSNLAPFRQLIADGLDAGVPRENDVFVIGPASGLSGAEAERAAKRALVVKDLLLGLGVPARHLAADAFSSARQ